MSNESITLIACLIGFLATVGIVLVVNNGVKIKELTEALNNSTKRLDAVFKNTGSLGCREQMRYNKVLLDE